MKGLLKRYSLERDTDGETPERFGDWCIRAGVIKATTDGKNFHDGVSDSFYDLDRIDSNNPLQVAEDEEEE
jgi:sulfite reductase (NADPH) hemoprotein beta-component